MDDNRSILRGKAGFAAINILIVVALLGGAITAAVGTNKVKEEFKKNGLTPNEIVRTLVYGDKAEQESPSLNPVQPQGQTSPVNPWIFPTNPERQPPPSQLPKEPGTDPSLGGGPINQPSDTWDPCEAKWESPDGGKTQALVPGSCTKPYHGANCSLAAAH